MYIWKNSKILWPTAHPDPVGNIEPGYASVWNTRKGGQVGSHLSISFWEFIQSIQTLSKSLHCQWNLLCSDFVIPIFLYSRTNATISCPLKVMSSSLELPLYQFMSFLRYLPWTLSLYPVNFLISLQDCKVWSVLCTFYIFQSFSMLCTSRAK